MGTPASSVPRRFHRVAFQRLEEAEVLFEAGYYNGSVYLAGYAVECMLKALILNSTPEKEHDSIEAEFRGQRAHHTNGCATALRKQALQRCRRRSVSRLPSSTRGKRRSGTLRVWAITRRFTVPDGNAKADRLGRQPYLAGGDNAMAEIIGPADEAVEQIRAVLEDYERSRGLGVFRSSLQSGFDSYQDH